MGASVSKSQVNIDNKDYRKTLDYIASNYILTQNFIDMKKELIIANCDQYLRWDFKDFKKKQKRK